MRGGNWVWVGATGRVGCRWVKPARVEAAVVRLAKHGWSGDTLERLISQYTETGRM